MAPDDREAGVRGTLRDFESTRYRYATWARRPSRSTVSMGSRSASSDPSTSGSMVRRSSSTPARPSRSSSSWASRAGRTPGTSWPRCCGPSRTTNPRGARSVARCPSCAPRSAGGGSSPAGRPCPSTAPGSTSTCRSSRPPPGRATTRACAGRRRSRAVRSWPGSRCATARTSTIGARRARSPSSDWSGTCSTGWRRPPRPPATCRARSPQRRAASTSIRWTNPLGVS